MQKINDNSENLLKMKEKLIVLTKNNKKLIDNDLLVGYINDYLELARSIFQFHFEELVNDLKAYNKSSHLENELKQLEVFEKKYDSLSSFYDNVRTLCGQYVDVSFDDLNIINIDNIRNKKKYILLYMKYSKYIERLKKELSLLNEELFKQNKKYSQNISIINKLEDNLITMFLNAEGRIIISDSERDNSSSIKEYEIVDVNLLKDKDNLELLNQKLITFERLKKEKDELLKSARICYKTLPTDENKEILDDIINECNLHDYYLCLLMIANKVFNKVNKCELAKAKRNEILFLIDLRKKYLSNMNIKYYIDHMDNIKIDEQIRELDIIDDNTKTAININKRIKAIDTIISNMSDKKDKYYSLINENYSFISIRDNYVPNVIKSIDEISSEFNISMVLDKANNVIKNIVSKLIVSKELKEENPVLVIDSVSNDITSDDLFEDYDSKSLFLENKEDIFNDDFSKDDIFEDTSESIRSSSLFEDKIPFDNEVKLVYDKEEPLEEIKLFEDKKDDLLDESLSEEDLSSKMPDIFWDVPEEVSKEDSFDIQLDNLSFLKKNSDDKVKKLVA